MIGIDLTYVNLDAHKTKVLSGSIEVFACDLLDSLEQINMEDSFVLITHPIVADVIRQRFPKYEIYEVGGVAFKLIYRLFKKDATYKFKKYGLFALLLKVHRINKVWFPFGTSFHVPGKMCDHMLTCHDLMMVDEKNDNEYRRMFTNAKKIVTISDYVKRQIVEKYGIEEGKALVIANSINFSNGMGKTKAVNQLIGKEFLFDCNSFAARKNTIVMIKAFERLCTQVPYDLVLCGGYKVDSYYDECRKYIMNHGLSNRIYLFLGLEESQKNWLFENCKIFITPSENEGFGRTPIEAALCLKPVISSRATALEESTCGLVHYINNPRSDEELANKIMEVLDNMDSRETLIEIRDAFSKKYSPENIANRYVDVFRQIGWID